MASDPATDRLFEKEYDELHTYARHNFQLYIAWYTFFMTSNMVAMGLIVAQALKGRPKDVMIAAIVGAYFCFQNIISVPGTAKVISMYEAMSRRLDGVHALLEGQAGALAGSAPVHAMVFGTYIYVVKLTRITLKSDVALWLFIITLAIAVAIWK